MNENVECPFCGTWFDPNSMHPRVGSCPLNTRLFSIYEWKMRPPKKEPAEQPNSDLLTFHLAGEIQWLRSIVEKLVVESPETNYSISYDAKDLAGDIVEKDDEIYAKRSGTGPDVHNFGGGIIGKPEESGK